MNENEAICLTRMLRFAILHAKPKGSNSCDVAPSLLHRHAWTHFAIKQPPKCSDQNRARKSSQPLLPTWITKPTIDDIKASLLFELDSSQIVGRQLRQKRQLQIRYVYQYRRHDVSLNLHRVYRCPQHIGKSRTNASPNSHHYVDSPSSESRCKILERE